MLCGLILALLPLLGSAEKLTGRVVTVVDSDTVHVLDANKDRHKIRLAGIYAPEQKQNIKVQTKFNPGARSRAMIGEAPIQKWLALDALLSPSGDLKPLPWDLL